MSLAARKRVDELQETYIGLASELKELLRSKEDVGLQIQETWQRIQNCVGEARTIAATDLFVEEKIGELIVKIPHEQAFDARQINQSIVEKTPNAQYGGFNVLSTGPAVDFAGK